MMQRNRLKEFEGIADCVLVDALCAGLGHCRHRPDVKWNKKAGGCGRIGKAAKANLAKC